MGFKANSDIQQRMRTVLAPDDASVLAYFKFDNTSGLYESYTQNTSRGYTWNAGVTIGFSSEPETTCYCTF